MSELGCLRILNSGMSTRNGLEAALNADAVDEDEVPSLVELARLFDDSSSMSKRFSDEKDAMKLVFVIRRTFSRSKPNVSAKRTNFLFVAAVVSKHLFNDDDCFVDVAGVRRTLLLKQSIFKFHKLER